MWREDSMWIPIDVTLPEHRKLVRLTRELGNISLFEALGRLVAFLCWIQLHRPDGVLVSEDSVVISLRFGSSFCEALASAGFLDPVEDRGNCSDDAPRWIVHDWGEFGGKLAERRKADAERKRRVRRTSSGHPTGHPVEVRHIESESESEMKTPSESSCSAASAEAVGAATVSFPCRGAVRVWCAEPAKVQEWIDSFPGLDVPAEIRKAAQWCRDNVDKQKTARGMTRFLGAWLNRAVDRPRSPATATTRLDDHGVRIIEKPARKPYSVTRPLKDGWGCSDSCALCNGGGVLFEEGDDIGFMCWNSRPRR